MNCSACGKPLPAGVTYCPNCGAPAALPYSLSGGTPDDPTARASEVTPPPPPFTGYGDQPYSSAPPNPYEMPSSMPYNPYPPAPPTVLPPTVLAPTAQPSSPPPPRGSNRIGLIVGVVILVLLLAGGGLFLALSKGGTTNNPSQQQHTPTVSPAQLTATGQAQATATVQAALTATAAANATATASVIAANPNPYPPGSGTLALLDPLSNNSLGYQWDIANNSSGSCAFTGGAYQVSTPKSQFFFLCASNSATYSNFAFEAQVKILKGDCGGLVFRGDLNAGKFYLFEVCQDGSYNLYIFRDYNGNSTLLANGKAAIIKAGLNQSNTLAVTAQGTALVAYVNSQKVASVTDTSYSHGSIALVTDAYNNPTSVAFSNARLWTL